MIARAHRADIKEHPDSRDRFVSKSAKEFWKNFPDRPETPDARKMLDVGFVVATNRANLRAR
jgi:hypothetical protein